jgi:hypothetical protein
MTRPTASGDPPAPVFSVAGTGAPRRPEADEPSPGDVPLWHVHIPTVDESCIRVRCRRASGRGPWPLSSALTELGRLDVRPNERFRSLGRGRGQPLIHSQEATWRGLDVHLESLVTSGGEVVEAALALPGMDEVVSRVSEDEWWELVDAFAVAVDAAHGALVDGEPVELEAADSPQGWRRRVGDHLALLVPGSVDAEWEPLACPYAALPASGLSVVLR